MMRIQTLTCGTILAALGMFADVAIGAVSLEEGFHNPPNSAKPHTWYHMMNGNVTKAGITCDFEALAKVGIGGVQMFDAGCNIPTGSLAFNSPEWLRSASPTARDGLLRAGRGICLQTE